MEDACHCHQDAFCDRHQLIGRDRYVALVAAEAENEQAAADLRGLRELAREVAKDYPDAADWKDARGKLLAMASQFVPYEDEEDEE